MKIELKNLKINLAFSDETTMFMADIYVDGERIGYAENDGHGGCTFYHVYEDKGSTSEKPIFKHNKAVLANAEAYCKTLPPFEYEGFDGKPRKLDMTLEMYIDELVNKEVERKERAKFAKKLEKDMLRGICYKTEGDNYSLVSWKGHTLASLLALPQGKMMVEQYITKLKKEGKVILNTNIPEYV